MEEIAKILIEPLKEARSFMNACQINDSDDPCDRSEDQSLLDDIKARIDVAIKRAEELVCQHS